MTTRRELSPSETRLRPANDDYAGLQSWQASVVHDFNNFLTPIMSILAELQHHQVGSPRQIRRIDGAIFCAYRASILARQLLDDGEPADCRPSILQLDELLARFEPVLASALPPNIILRFTMLDHLPPVRFDQALLERALLNLTLNARDAMPDGGELLVDVSIARPVIADARQADLMVRLSVSDTGIGMSSATLKRVGKLRFSTKMRGSGFGLVTVRQILERQGGRMSISSIEGRGATVELWLPIAGLSQTTESIGTPESPEI